jgi:predicted transcriptional regulator
MTITTNENTPKRRDKLVIIAEIIDIAKNGTSKTHIMFKANLSFIQLNQYLSALMETDLLEKRVVEGREIYRATDKGLDFVEKQCEIINLLNVDFRNLKVKTSFDFNPFPKGKPLTAKPTLNFGSMMKKGID